MKTFVSGVALRGGVSVLALTMACVWASETFAADAAAANDAADAAISKSGTDVEELVVTARKREENLQDVPLAISAFTQETLRESNVTSLEGLATLTPGLAVASIGGTYQAPVIRGLAQIDQTAAIGNVGVFIDGVYINNRSGQEFSFLDIARIEVLKGPQSASYGQNTFSGAIDYVTKEPVLKEYDGYVTTQFGDYGLKSGQASVNIPLGDMWAIRLAGGRSSFDGTIPNQRDGGDLGGWKSHSNYSGSVLFQPNDDIKVKAFYTRTDTADDQSPYVYLGVPANNCGDKVQGLNGVAFTLFCGKLPVPTSVNLLSSSPASGLVGYNALGYVTGDWDMKWATLSGTVGYTNAKFNQNNDTAGFAAALSTPLSPGSPLSQQTFLTAVGTGSQETSYDLRLTSPAHQKVTWMAGLYDYESVVNDALVSYNALLNNINSLVEGFFSGGHKVFDGHAVYAQVGWDVTDRLNLAAEGREAYDTYKISLPTNAAVKGEQKFTAFTPRFTATFKLDSDDLIYASAARGAKIGGFNTNAFGLPQFTYGPETNWTYEAGFKGSFFDRKLVIDADVYYIDWTGIQVQTNIPSSQTSVVVNDLGATSYGLEWDSTYNFTHDLWVRLGFTVLNPTYKPGTSDGEVLAPCGEVAGQTGILVKGCSSLVGGNQLSRTSDAQASLAGQWTVPEIIHGFDGYVRADYSYQAGRHYLSLENNDEGAINLVNGRIGIKRRDFEFAFFGNNLMDYKYLDRSTQTAAAAAFGAGVINVRLYPGERRTWGFEARYAF